MRYTLFIAIVIFGMTACSKTQDLESESCAITESIPAEVTMTDVAGNVRVQQFSYDDQHRLIRRSNVFKNLAEEISYVGQDTAYMNSWTADGKPSRGRLVFNAQGSRLSSLYTQLSQGGDTESTNQILYSYDALNQRTARQGIRTLYENKKPVGQFPLDSMHFNWKDGDITHLWLHGTERQVEYFESSIGFFPFNAPEQLDYYFIYMTMTKPVFPKRLIKSVKGPESSEDYDYEFDKDGRVKTMKLKALGITWSPSQTYHFRWRCK